MEKWKKIVTDSLHSTEDLCSRFKSISPEIAKVAKRYPVRINSYYLQLIEYPGDPFWKQAIPDPLELTDQVCLDDPLDEENLSPVPNLVHKYPDRALFLISNQCAMYCRFCTRKRMVGSKRMHISAETISEGIRFIKQTPTIREVLLSGGDPLLLEDHELDSILSRLHAIPSLEVIRIGTRVPCTLPMRITDKLVSILSRYHPLYINTHFNHPKEITEQAALCCAKLANGGIPLANQTVLLKGINDNLDTIRTLMLSLLRIRVKPYYLFQADLTRGTNHFRTTTSTGLSIMKGLIGHISGMAVPTYAIDGPGGMGKIPLTPEYIVEQGEHLLFRNYQNRLCSYPESLEICDR